MNDQRISAFSDLGDFTPKAKSAPRADQARLEKVAEEAGFISRQAPKPKPQRKMGPRNPHTTGRNKQLNIKASDEAIERLHKVADAERLPLGEMLERLLDAYEARKADPKGVAKAQELV